MSKIYISVDTEGLNGITSFKQVLPEYSIEYSQMLPQLHNELNSLIDGLKEAGIEEITVNDAHNTMTNLSITNLPNDIQLITGKPKKISMMYGLDNTYDGVIFLAYHSMAKSSGVLAHTFNMHFKGVYLNDELISEAKLNGIYSSIIGVPIILASGDNVFISETNSDLPELETIQTKIAINNTAAICRKNSDLFSEYKNKGKNINNFPKCFYKTYSEYHLKVEFESTNIAQEIAMQSELNVINNCLHYKTNDYIDLYTILQKISAITTNYFM